MFESAIVKYHKIEMFQGKQIKKWAMVVVNIEQAMTAITVLEQPQQRRFELAQGLAKCLDYLIQKYPNNVERISQAVTLNCKTETGIHKETPKPVPERVATFLFYALCLKDASAVEELVRKLGRFVAGEDVGVINATESPDIITDI